MERASNAIRRCAVYTRKSSEEGLETRPIHPSRRAGVPCPSATVDVRRL